LGKFQQTQSNLVIATISFKLGYYCKDLGKVEEVHSDLHVINIWVNCNSPNEIWANWNNLIQIWV